MNEEEKKLINDLKNQVNEPLKANENYVDTFILVNIKECKQLINLIEKLEERLEEIDFNKSALETLKECVHKDKIKEKIEEITSYAYTSAEERDCQDYAIQVLKDLLGE